MTPTEIPDFAPPPEPAPMSEAGRLIGVFVSPGAAFADIAKRPRWWVPLLLSTIVATVYLYMFSQHVGWGTFVTNQMEQSNSQVPAQQRAQLVALAERIGPIISICLGLFASILGSLVIAGVLKLTVDTILGAALGFKRILAAVTYGALPNLLKTILSAVVLMVQPPDEFNLQSPLMFNVGAFLSKDAPRWLITLGTSFDLFTFWSMFLTAMGLAAASRKMSTGKAFFTILFLWALVVCLSVGATALSR